MFARIEEIGIIPAVRTSSAADALFASESVLESGIPVVEITMTTPGALEVIRQLARTSSDAIVGAGTILDLETARACLDAGASFLTSTGLDLEFVHFALQHNTSVIPGTLTPSEVMVAKKAGCTFTKIFPCASLGGPSYIRALRGPFPHMKLIASGGVTQQNASDFIRCGSNALGIGQELLPGEAIFTRNSNWIHELSRRFIDMVKQARNSKPSNGPARK